jgi:hypothetical protein
MHNLLFLLGGQIAILCIINACISVFHDQNGRFTVEEDGMPG